MKVRLVCFSGVDRQVVPQAFAGVVNRLVDTGCYIPVNLPSILHTVWYFACVCVFVCLVICMHVPSLSVIFNFDMNQSSCKHSFSRSKNPMILFYSIFSSAIGYVYVECEMFEVERVRGQCLLSLSLQWRVSIYLFLFLSRVITFPRVTQHTFFHGFAKTCAVDVVVFCCRRSSRSLARSAHIFSLKISYSLFNGVSDAGFISKIWKHIHYRKTYTHYTYIFAESNNPSWLAQKQKSGVYKHKPPRGFCLVCERLDTYEQL